MKVTLVVLLSLMATGCANLGFKVDSTEAHGKKDVRPARDFVAYRGYEELISILDNGEVIYKSYESGTPQVYSRRLKGSEPKKLISGFNSKTDHFSGNGRILLRPVELRDPSDNSVKKTYAVYDFSGESNREHSEWDYLVGLEVEGDFHFERYLRDDLAVVFRLEDSFGALFYKFDFGTRTLGKLPVVGEDNEKYYFDLEGVISARIKRLDSSLMVEIAKGGDFETIYTCDKSDHVRFLSVDDARIINLETNCKRDRIGLHRVNVETKKLLIFEDGVVDSSSTIIDPENGAPLFSLYDNFRTKTVPYSVEGERLKRVVEGLRLTSFIFRSISNNKEWVAIESSGIFGSTTYAVNLLSSEATILKPSRFEGVNSLPTVEELSLRTLEGEEVFSLLYKTREAIKGKPSIVYLHGGPRSRLFNRFNRLPIFLSTRGYNVLAINYRGSTGYGKAYAEAPKDNIKVVTEDISLAQAYLENVLGSQQIGVIGESFGGYLAVLQLHSANNVECAGAVSALYDLEYLAEKAGSAYDRGFLRFFFGPREKIGKASNEFSPILLGSIPGDKKLLMVHGKDDLVAPFVSAWRYQQKNSDKVDLLAFDNEGHTIFNWRNRLKLFKKIEKYFSNCLGGRDSGFDLYSVF